ncbi:hypothetical protein, partial [Streptomyces sp. DSM 40484]|uniref:hypothetical protein n=1 Tax=Streptomyces kroppenstedtii TaxID=3051181 RepID=UPI0028D1D11F
KTKDAFRHGQARTGPRHGGLVVEIHELEGKQQAEREARERAPVIEVRDLAGVCVRPDEEVRLRQDP